MQVAVGSEIFTHRNSLLLGMRGFFQNRAAPALPDLRLQTFVCLFVRLFADSRFPLLAPGFCIHMLPSSDVIIGPSMDSAVGRSLAISVTDGGQRAFGFTGTQRARRSQTAACTTTQQHNKKNI